MLSLGSFLGKINGMFYYCSDVFHSVARSMTLGGPVISCLEYGMVFPPQDEQAGWGMMEESVLSAFACLGVRAHISGSTRKSPCR